MLPILQLGPLALQTPGLILLAGLWFGLVVSEKYAVRFRVRPEQIYNLTLTMLITGVIGARLSEALQFPSAFLENPFSLISLNPALLDPFGGMVIALVAGLIYGNKKGLKIGPTLDALSPALGILAIAISFSNLTSGSAFGTPTNLPWRIYLWQEFRHPTQIYQMVLQGLILWAIWPKAEQSILPNGRSFVAWVSLSAGARIFVETFRADSVLLMNGLRQAQVIAWLILAISLVVLDKLRTEKIAIK